MRWNVVPVSFLIWRLWLVSELWILVWRRKGKILLSNIDVFFCLCSLQCYCYASLLRYQSTVGPVSAKYCVIFQFYVHKKLWFILWFRSQFYSILSHYGSTRSHQISMIFIHCSEFTLSYFVVLGCCIPHTNCCTCNRNLPEENMVWEVMCRTCWTLSIRTMTSVESSTEILRITNPLIADDICKASLYSDSKYHILAIVLR